MPRDFKTKSKINKNKMKGGVMKNKNNPKFKKSSNAVKTAIFSNNQKPVANKPFDFTILEEKINNLKALGEESNNKKARKKIRQLEYLKKKHTQIQNTENSLKINVEDDLIMETEINDPVIEEEISEKSGNESEEDEDPDKTETLKGIKRFVVFVGNLPKSVTEDDLKNHFSKVGGIKSVRIPESKENRKNGFAFIELNDQISFEKTLSMHHTMLNNKRLNVSFTNPDGTNIDRKEIKKKNAKFDAMRKAGLLAGSTAEHKKRSFRRKKKRLAEAKAAASA